MDNITLILVFLEIMAIYVQVHEHRHLNYLLRDKVGYISMKLCIVVTV